MGTDIEKDADIVDISDEIKDKVSEEGEEKKSEKKKKKKEPHQKEVSVNEFRKAKKKGRTRVFIILIVIALIIGFVVYKVNQAKKKLEEMLENNKVQTARIERMDLSSTINTTGTIQSKDVRTITSPLSGVKIDEVNCKVGDMVQAGSVIVTFSREDINKKIGQLEEDITEAKQAKALDGSDRTNTYVNSYDLQTYSVATTYEKFKKAEADLQKAKDDLSRACSEKGDYKSKYEEAKEKIDGAKDDLIHEQEILAQIVDKTSKAYFEQNQKVSEAQSKVTEYQQRISGYDSGITTYENAERTAQTALDNAQRNYDNAWVDYNKAGYDASFSDAKSDYTKAKGDLQANDNIKNLQRQKEQSEDSLDNYIVTAPITGLVTSVNAQEGNGYQATTGALVTIQAVDVFEVTTQVDEYDINNVRVGQKVAIITDATGKDEIEGRVTFVAPTATVVQGSAAPTSSTFEVKIDILNKDDRLKLGMSAKLNILVDTHENVLAVPFDAIEQKDDGENYIYVTDAAPESSAAKDKDSDGGITVIGTDGEEKGGTGSADMTTDLAQLTADAKKNAKEIKVTVGLEGDFYTEVSSPEIREGMTVLVDSKAGNLNNDLQMLMGM